MRIHKINSGFQTVSFHDPYIRLGAGAEIVDSHVVGNMTVDKFSCVNRCDVGQYFGLGCYSYIANSKVGRYCTFGSRISVGAFSHPTDWLSIHEFQYRDTTHIYGNSILESNVNIAPRNAATEIGCDVWIGDNASVRAGVSLGHGAIVGLGAVVVSNVPPFAIVGGNPARILRYRFNETVINTLLALKWWELDMSQLKGVDFGSISKAIEFIEQVRKDSGPSIVQ